MKNNNRIHWGAGVVVWILITASGLVASPVWAVTAKICIDAGHGGTDSGAVGSGLVEKTLNLDVSLKFKDWLDKDTADAAGGGSWTVIMTRSTDVYVTLQGRCDYANNNNADRFMCIHTNAYDGTAHGIETYCATSLGISADLRLKVYEEATAVWPLTQRGVKTANFTVLVNTSMPAELHEMGFIDNATDAVYLGSDAHRNNHALSELYAIQRHYGLAKYKPGSAATATPTPSPTSSPTSSPTTSPTSSPSPSPSPSPSVSPSPSPPPSPTAARRTGVLIR